MFNLKKFGMAIVGLLVGALFTGVLAHDTPNMSERKMPAAFEKLKGLVGTWIGKDMMDGKPMKIVVTYELTAGGTALVERDFKGSPHEMTTVYYPEGDQVCMTHYCMLGNHPQMVLKKSTDDSLAFEMKGNTGISSSKEAHMHAMTITWKDKNHITSQWTEFVDGKKQGECVGFNLTRKNKK